MKRNLGLSFPKVVGEIISQVGILNTFTHIYFLIPFLILTPEAIARNLSSLLSFFLSYLPPSACSNLESSQKWQLLWILLCENYLLESDENFMVNIRWKCSVCYMIAVTLFYPFYFHTITRLLVFVVVCLLLEIDMNKIFS